MRLSHSLLQVVGLLGVVSALTSGAMFATAQDREDKPARELTGGPWLNTRQGAPITLASAKAK